MTTTPPDPREVIAQTIADHRRTQRLDGVVDAVDRSNADAILAALGAVGLVVGPAAVEHADDELLAAAKALPRPPFGAYARWADEHAKARRER